MPTLNHRVTIQRRAAGEDDLGQPSGAWVTHAELWADVQWPTGVAAGRERIMAGADVSSMPCSVMLRKRDDLTPGMRVLHDGAALDVQAIAPSDRARGHMFLVCQRVQS
jgi:SPP1 family predicted phage head-tail adaptor